MSNLPFDPAAFLDATTTEANERRQPLPVENPDHPNGLYIATIGELKPPKSGTIEKGERTGQPWVSMQIPLKIDVPAVLQESLKLPPQLTFTDGVFLDLTPNGTEDNAPGKNRRKRAYRDATGTNVAGEPFKWRDLQGRVVAVQISHRVLDDGAVMEEIKNILPA